MFLSNFSVRRPVATVVILIALMALGLMALSKLKVNQNPDVDLPLLVVDIAYPGASPETVEREVEDIEHHLTPQTLAALTALVGYWKEHPAELQAFRRFQARRLAADKPAP